MDLAIHLTAGDYSLGFGIYTEDDQKENLFERLNDIDEYDMQEAFWENYYEIEPEVEKSIAECTIRRENYESDLAFHNSVSDWMRQRLKAIFSPVVVEITINDSPVNITLPFDVEEAFFDILSDTTTDKYIQKLRS